MSRLAGTDRIGTAVAISQHVFPTPFGSGGSVYLTRMDVFADAMAAGTLTDGPVLLVPSCAVVPQVVKDEVTRLSPARVVALGGTGAVCDQVLTEAAAGRQTARLVGVDRYLTSLEIARERAKQGPVIESVSTDFDASLVSYVATFPGLVSTDPAKGPTVFVWTKMPPS